jgi:D-alanyl-D-alanine carboxypeptidase
MRAAWLVAALLLCTSSQGSGPIAGQPSTPRAVDGHEAAELDRWLTVLYPAPEPGAAVFIRRGDDVLVRKGYGVANLEWGTPISPSTAFRLASITKQFTAAATLMLAQDGRLALDDRVSKHLPETRNAATLEHLLTHTSGLASLDAIPGFAVWSRTHMEPRELLAMVDAQPRVSVPGQDWIYSDANYLLLGAIVERAAGMPFERFLRTRIFEPLHMEHSAFDSGVNVIAHRADGYTLAGGRFEKAPSRDMSVAFSAGAVVSTIDDLALWDRALSGGSLVERRLLDRAFTPSKLADGRSTSYGYGWLVTSVDGVTVLQHGGRIEGFGAHIIRVPERRIFIAVLSNATNREPAPDFVATTVLHRLLGHHSDRPVDLTGVQQQQYVGRYRIAEGPDYVVARSAERLLMRRDPGPVRELVALGHDRFRFTTSYTSVQFGRDLRARVDRLTVKPAYAMEQAGRRVGER